MEGAGPITDPGQMRELGTDVLLDPAFPYGEELLQFIWEAGLYDATSLHTTDGEPVEVEQAGRIQPNSGPDLADAQVRIAGQLWAGNVEVHLRASDWNAHGHQGDPAYNNVVLHTVYHHDADVYTQNGHRLPTVELRQRIAVKHLRLHKELMEARKPIPCAAHVHRVDMPRTRLWLNRLLVERLERKTAEVEALYHQLGNDPTETLHHMLLRSLGAKVNAEPFAMLAHALPAKLLLKCRDDLVRVEALLFGQAGFLEGAFRDAWPQRLLQEYRWLANVHGLRPVPVSAWKFGRMRPANFPTVRLAQWAALFTQGPEAYGMLLEHDDPAAVCRMLQVEAGAYWQDHYRFDQPAAPRAKRIGRSTAEGLIINAIVPYLFAMGRIRGFEPWKERALTLLECLPPEENAIVREWAHLGVKADSAIHSQALLELRNRYCKQRRCLSCAIGLQLHQQLSV